MNLNALDNKRILIVDDDELFTKTVSHFLSHKNINFHCVHNLKAARDLLNQNSFDMILLDNYLPDGQGVDFMVLLNERQTVGPVVLITADDDDILMQKCLDSGASDYLLKPIRMEFMWVKLNRSFSAYMLEQQLSKQNQQLERLLAVNQHEQQLTRHVYRHLANSNRVVSDGIRTYQQSSGELNGDIFIFGVSPAGNHLMLLVDAAGHGLAAAISVLPVVSTLKTMVKKGFSLVHIIHEINAKIYAEIPDDRFVACIGIEVDFQRQDIHFFNGGMPDILVIDEQCNIVDKIKSDCLPLGITDAKEFYPTIQRRDIVDGEHLLFHSNGLIHQPSCCPESFSQSNLYSTLAGCDAANDATDTILNAVSKQVGERVLDDDISLCYIDIGQLNASQLTVNNGDEQFNETESGHIILKLELAGPLLAKANIIDLLDQTLKNLGVGSALRQKAFTIFLELINNGLDHGILQLDSELKNDLEGFQDYIEQRATRLNSLSTADRLTLTLAYRTAENTLRFSVRDSGSGYQRTAIRSATGEALAGRGLKLIEKLSEQFVVHEPGNKTTVLIK